MKHLFSFLNEAVFFLKLNQDDREESIVLQSTNLDKAIGFRAPNIWFWTQLLTVSTTNRHHFHSYCLDKVICRHIFTSPNTFSQRSGSIMNRLICFTKISHTFAVPNFCSSSLMFLLDGLRY